MLLFLVICAFLRSLQGAPVLPPNFVSATSSVAAADQFGVMTCRVNLATKNQDQHLRTVYEIVKSCLLTIFACVWTSVHPNINGPRDSWWTCIKRQVVTTLCAVIAPEMVLYWVVRQYVSAKKIAEQYNKEFANLGLLDSEETDTSIKGKFRGLFQSLPKSTTRRGNGQSWTTTHGFFIQMGGFILYDNQYPKEVLEYNRLAQLIRNNTIDTPTVTEHDLQDRSKGDVISKAIVMLQMTWFVLQCIARLGEHLPLSELEVLTVAFAVMNMATYTAWWNKPQRVGTAICIPLKGEGKGANDSTTPLAMEEIHDNPSHPRPANLLQPEYRHWNHNWPLITSHKQRNEYADQKDSYLRHMLRKDRQEYSLPVFLLVRLPYRIICSVLHPFNKMGEDFHFRGQQLRVPIFYSMDVESKGPTLIACSIGVIFGATHLLGWTLEFPSPRARDILLWRVSAIVLSTVPFFPILLTVVNLEMYTLGFGIIMLLFSLSTFLYVAARFSVIVIAFKAIRHPSHRVLLDVSWTTYIPHF